MDETTTTFAVNLIRREQPSRKYLATVWFAGSNRIAYGPTDEAARANLSEVLAALRASP
jgi:hypothetical protein